MKIIERPDGSREIEGSPAELREYDRDRKVIERYIIISPPAPAVIPYIAPIPGGQPYGPGIWPGPAPDVIWCGSTGAPASQPVVGTSKP